MGRAIGILTFIVFCSFVFVGLQLRHGHARPVSPNRTIPALAPREDGSVYALSYTISGFENRLIDAEKRAESLSAQVQKLQRERDDEASQVEDLQDEVRRLRAQVNQPPKPAPRPEGTQPSSVVPGNRPANPPVTAPSPTTEPDADRRPPG